MVVSREPEFRTTRMREGYDLDAVDDFVDLVIDALDGRGGGEGITPEQIEAEEFKVVRMREGYVMDDVDDWLDAAAVELRRIRKNAPASAPAPRAAAAPSVPEQHRQTPAPPVGYPPPTSAMPAVGPGYAATGAVPTGIQGYQGYADVQPPGMDAGEGYAAQYGHGALSDSAVNELDPVLRALDPSFGAESTMAGAAPVQPARVAEPAIDDQMHGASATPATGLHHIEIWVRDIDAATRSFGWLFERLGWTLFQAWDNGRSWQAPGGGPYVVVESSPDLTWVAYDRKAPGLNHLALAVPERWMVDRIVSEAPAYGWHLMFADRHPYAGGPHHYAAYMENDEGYEVEVVAP